jgi:hypothetical protein
VEGWCPADGVRTASSAWSVPLTSSGLRDRGCWPGHRGAGGRAGSGVNDLPGWNRQVIRFGARGYEAATGSLSRSCGERAISGRRCAHYLLGITAETLSQGFGFSADSNETVVAINPAANGDTAATLTFTSHQNASQVQHGHLHRLGHHPVPGAERHRISDRRPALHLSRAI